MKVNIITALGDNALMGNFMKGDSWFNWKVFLKSLQGLPMTPEEFDIFKQATKRTVQPDKPFTESYVIASRRAGKRAGANWLSVLRLSSNETCRSEFGGN